MNENLLILLNEWWESGVISDDKAKKYKRKVYENIEKSLLGYRQILVLNGIRRVGKSTIMFQLIQRLLGETDPKNILYFSFDEAVEDLVELMEAYSRITKTDWRSEKVFVFLDEIQKLKGWSSKIKILYDNFPNLRICVSGSASLMVENETVKNLAGRYFLEHVGTLTLQEFAELYFGREIDNYELHELEIKRIFGEYIRKPFPEIIMWEDQAKAGQYIRELVVEKIIGSDIPATFGNANMALVTALVEIFMKDAGMILELSSLSRDLGVHKLTLSSHIKFLESAGVISVVRNYRPSIRSESRKLRKVYPSCTAFSFCFHQNMESGKIYETLVLAALGLDKYWRQGVKEIDFLKLGEEMLPIEVKESPSVGKKDLKNILYFAKKYNVGKGVVVYTGKEDSITIRNKKLTLMPVYKLLFNPAVFATAGKR